MFVVLGATGKVGRTTIRQLRSQGAPVRAVVRKSSNADDLSASGCEIAAADLNEAAAVKIAIRGADAVQVICPVQAQAQDAAGAMEKTIDAIASMQNWFLISMWRITPGASMSSRELLISGLGQRN